VHHYTVINPLNCFQPKVRVSGGFHSHDGVALRFFLHLEHFEHFEHLSIRAFAAHLLRICCTFLTAVVSGIWRQTLPALQKECCVGENRTPQSADRFLSIC